MCPARMSAEIDEKILQQFGESPSKGLRLLFDVYYTPLAVYAFQLTDSYEMAEDVVQDALTYFWEKEYYRQVNTNLRGYLFFAVRNAALAELKKYAMKSMEELSGMEVDIPEELLDADEYDERANRLLADLERLPHQEMMAIKLVIMGNKKYKEAAEELGLSVNTLKTHLSRGLTKLRRKHNLMLFF